MQRFLWGVEVKNKSTDGMGFGWSLLCAMLCTLHAGDCFRSIYKVTQYNSKPSLYSGKEDYEKEVGLIGSIGGTVGGGTVGTTPMMISSKEEIFGIINEVLLETAEDGSQVNTKALIESAHILAMNNLYEEAMEELLNSRDVSKESVLLLEQVDAVIKSFINSERKTRSRLKVNYLISGALSDRLEAAVLMLANTNEIDDNLLRFVDSLIHRRISLAAGPTASFGEEDEDMLSGSGKVAVDVLKLIHKRLKVEIKMKGNVDLKLMAVLVRENNEENYESIIKKELTSVEKFESFSAFLDSGLEHLSKAIRESNVDTDTYTDTDADGKEIDTNVITLQKMREIKRTVQSLLGNLKTGLLDENDLFSTSPDDYASSGDISDE